MRLFLYSAGITLWACLCLVACKEETELMLDFPDNPAQPPMEDILDVKIKQPVCVMGAEWDAVGQALCNRVEQRQSEIDDRTRIVLLGADVQQLTPEQITNLKKVCDANGAIGICNPTFTFAESLLQALDIKGAHVKDADDDNGHYVDMLFFNRHGDVCELNDIHDTDKLPYVTIDPDGNETTGKVTPDNTSLTSYEYGLYADAAAAWLNDYSVLDTQQLPQAICRMATDLKAVSHAQSQRFVYSPSFSRDDDTTTTEKAKGRSGVYQVTYTIYSFYSFEQQADYYMVHQEVIGNNAPMFIGNWKNGGNNCYGFYLGCIDNEHWIHNAAGALDLNVAELHDPTPVTSTGSTSVTSGYSVDFGGNIGLSLSGPSAGLSGGGSFSESYTTTLPNVAITNRSLTDGCNASWFYDCGSAPVVSNGWSVSMKDSPLITRSTIVLQNCWYWKVPMTEDSDEVLLMEYNNRVIYDYTWLHDAVFSYSYGNKGGGFSYQGIIKLTPPNRTKPK